MLAQKYRLPSIAFAALILTAGLGWAMSEGLGQTKEQLKLQYDITVVDYHNGRVGVILIIADQGRLKPLSSVDLMIPSKDKAANGGYLPDVALSLAIHEADGKQSVRFELTNELAQRAQIELRTSSLDGKQGALESYYYTIPIAPYLKTDPEKKN